MKESKEHILKVAFNLFLQKSFKEVTMKEIVEKTGLSKGAFYYYFTSKEQLFFEVNSYYFSLMAENAFTNIKAVTLRQFYLEALDRMGRVLTAFLGGKTEIGDNKTFNYFTMMFDALSRFPELREKMIAHDRKELDIWKERVARARMSGEIRSKMSDEQIAKVFLFTSDGVAVRLIMEHRFKDLWDELSGLWGNFYTQLALKAPEPPMQ
jgi:AcrR family transcriptional regulator